MTSSARARTRDPLQAFILRLRSHRPPVLLDVGLLHALRDCCADCYERGHQDAHCRSTVPAPPDDEDTQRYAITHPLQEEKLR